MNARSGDVSHLTRENRRRLIKTREDFIHAEEELHLAVLDVIEDHLGIDVSHDIAAIINHTGWGASSIRSRRKKIAKQIRKARRLAQ